MSIQERKIIMLNEKMSKEEQEFIQLYRNADAATRYAVECGLTLFKGKYDREELEPVHIKIASKIIAKVRFPKYKTSSLS